MAEEIMPDVGDPAYVKETVKKARNVLLAKQEILRDFLATPEGRRYFYDLLTTCGVYRNPFSRDAGMMAFSCGEMNVGQKILVDLENASPELYLLMVRENNHD